MVPMDTNDPNRTQFLDGQPDGELDRTILRPRALDPASTEAYAGVPVSSTAPLSPVTPVDAERTPRSTRNRTRHSSEPRHGCLSFFLWIIAAVIFGLCIVRMLPLDMSSATLIPETVSLVPLFIAPAAIILVLALLWHRGALALLAGTSLALLLWWHAGYFIPAGSLSPTAQTAASPASEPSTEDTAMRIMTLNVYNGHASADEVVACVRENNVELLAIQEASWAFLDELEAAGIYDVLPYTVWSDAGEWDNGGLNCLFAMTPLYDTDSDLLPTELSAMSAGTIDIGGRALRFVSCHPGSPHLGGQDLWNAGLDTIGSLSDYDHAYVIMGDFNSTWNHARFRALLGESFVDASQQAGEGFHMTWPSDLSAYVENSLPVEVDVPQSVLSHVPAIIEIDHIVYAADAGIYVGGFKTARISGTDHLALIATLEVS